MSHDRLINVTFTGPLSVETAATILQKQLRTTASKFSDKRDKLFHAERAISILCCGQCIHCCPEEYEDKYGNQVIGIRCDAKGYPAELSRRTPLGEEANCTSFKPIYPQPEKE